MAGPGARSFWIAGAGAPRPVSGGTLAGILLAGLLAGAAPPLSGQSPPTTRPPENPGGSAVPPTVGAPTEASAVCTPGAEPGTGRGLKAADADGDGRLSRAEFTRFHEDLFQRLPKDREGRVSIEDAMRHGGLGPERRGNPPAAPGTRPPRGDREPQTGRPADTTGRGASPPSPTTPAAIPPAPAPAPEAATSPARPEARLPRSGGSTSPDGEPDRGRASSDAAGSSTSTPSSTPSSTAPQEAKPGRR